MQIHSNPVQVAIACWIHFLAIARISSKWVVSTNDRTMAVNRINKKKFAKKVDKKSDEIKGNCHSFRWQFTEISAYAHFINGIQSGNVRYLLREIKIKQ